MCKIEMKYSTIIACVLIAWVVPLRAEDIKVDSMTFRSQNPSVIKKYLSAREQFRAADEHYASMREGYTKGTATIQDYVKAQEDFVAAREKMLLLEADLEILPTLPKGEPITWSQKEKRQQWTEARKVKDRLPLIKENMADAESYETKLKSMLARFRGHAAEGVILLAFGDLYEISPETASKYYEEVTKCRVPSDAWGFVQQSAWQRLAVIHEKNGAYQEAVRALQNWRISEPCGTGADGSYIRRSFKIWELKLYYLPQDRVFKELWEELESERIIFRTGETIDGLAQRVRTLYGHERSNTIKETVDQLQKRHPVEGDAHDLFRPGQHFARLVAELISQLQFVEEVEEAQLQQVLTILTSVRNTKGAPHIHGELTRLNVPYKNIYSQYWREELIITRLTSFPAERSVPSLITSDSERHNCSALYVIGKAGGERAIQYLFRKTRNEDNVWYLRDYYFSLLLMGDRAATVFVKQAATEGEGNNRTAAMWALENSPLHSKEAKNIEQGAEGDVVNRAP